MSHDDKHASARDKHDSNRTTPADESTDQLRDEENDENPPNTTTGWLTSPKFGSAGSGGAELEPGPERD